MNKNRRTIQSWVFTKSADQELPEVEYDVDQDDTKAPSETYYFPDRIPLRDPDPANSADPLFLAGIPLRLEFIETAELRLKSVPEEFKARIYRTKQFEIGLSDGFQAIPPVHSVESLTQMLEIEKRLAYPVRIKEKIASHEAERRKNEAQITVAEQRLAELRDKKHGEEVELQALKDKRREINDANLEKELSLRETELQRFERERNHAEEAGGDDTPAEPAPERRTSIVSLITGLLLTSSALTFILADVSLSIMAIYALGFSDNGVGWGTAIFNTSHWVTHWEGISVCLGIAFITFFFKYIYELLQDSERRPPIKKLFFLVPVGILCLLTVLELGYLRAEYITSNLASQTSTLGAPTTYLGIEPKWVKIGMVLTTVLFPLIGAVLLSEGLTRVFDALSGITKSLYKKSVHIRSTLKWTNIDFMPGTLANRIKHKEQSVADLTTKITQTQDQIIALQSNIDQISFHIPVWQEALGEYNERWESIHKLELSMYRHGYEQGKKLHAQSGIYKRIRERLSGGSPETGDAAA